MPTILRCHLATNPTSLQPEQSSSCPFSAPSALETSGLFNDGAVDSCLEKKRPRREAVTSLLPSPQIKQRGPKTKAQTWTLMTELWRFVVRISVMTTQSMRFFCGRPASFETTAGNTLQLPSVYLPFHFITHWYPDFLMCKVLTCWPYPRLNGNAPTYITHPCALRCKINLNNIYPVCTARSKHYPSLL